MVVTNFSDDKRDVCAGFWWKIYEHMSYVHLPDGYQNVQSHSYLDPDYFLKRLDPGLSCNNTKRWHGEVRHDTIFLAWNGDDLQGILVCSMDEEEKAGGILSAFMHRNAAGQVAAAQLLGEALQFFQKSGADVVCAAPSVSKTLEAECPIHLALLDAGFAWQDNWESAQDEKGDAFIKSGPGYEVFLGGSLAEFEIGPDIRERIARLESLGIKIERYTPDRFDSIYRIDTQDKVHLPGDEQRNVYQGKIEGECTFVALMDEYAVGWLWEINTYSDGEENGTPRVMGGCVPMVVPQYRNTGIGKALYYLGIEEAIKQGAQHGWTATGMHNTARMIYQSIGYQYWYLGFNLITKQLRA